VGETPPFFYVELFSCMSRKNNLVERLLVVSFIRRKNRRNLLVVVPHRCCNTILRGATVTLVKRWVLFHPTQSLRIVVRHLQQFLFPGHPITPN